MRLQLHRRRPLLNLRFHPPVQLLDLGFQAVQRLQQLLPPFGRVGQQFQLLQLRPPRFSPQLPLLLHSLAQGHGLQLVLHSRPRLHLLVAMHQQLPHVPLLQTRHPDPRKPILPQQIQQMLRVPPVRLLLAYHLGPDFGRIPQPQLVASTPPAAARTTDSARRPPSPPAPPAPPARDRTVPLLRGVAIVSSEFLPFGCQRSRPAENSDENHSL